MSNRAKRQVRLGNLSHRDRSLHASGNARLSNEVLQREGVHDRSEHPHVVSTRALKTFSGELGAAEEVTTADDDGDLYSFANRARHLLGDIAHDRWIQANRSTSECLSR